MSKNIALFIDGTWNNADKKEETNVHRLYKAAYACSERSPEVGGIPIASNAAAQVVYYLKGVGTGGKLDKWFGGMTGFGTEDKIKKAYLFLASNYQSGDNVYLFGFSRGAFAARSLAAFVGVVGHTLSSKATQKKVAEAYMVYVNARGEESFKQALRDDLKINAGLIAEMRPIPIRFIGVWDTVKTLGVQVRERDLTAYWTKHHDHPKLPAHISHARHALALHDLRPEFEPTLWEDWEKPQSLQQVWFPGAHSDVGGGYAKTETELSDGALRWMACESVIYGLDLNPGELPTVSISSSGSVHQEKKVLHSLGPRKILSEWNSHSKEKMIKSFFMHETACKQLLNATSRQYYCPANSKSKSPKGELISVKDNDYGALLTKVDDLTLTLHLALSFKYSKRLIR